VSRRLIIWEKKNKREGDRGGKRCLAHRKKKKKVKELLRKEEEDRLSIMWRKKGKVRGTHQCSERGRSAPKKRERREGKLVGFLRKRRRSTSSNGEGTLKKGGGGLPPEEGKYKLIQNREGGV